MSYKIVRVYRKARIRRRVIARGLTLEEAKEWCRNPDTSSSTCTTKVGKDRTRKIGDWFDAYDKE